MFLKHMRPDQVQDAIAKKAPLLLPAGCIECHGSHAALGLDTMAAEELCNAIAGRLPAVVAPSVEYGPTGWAVSGPELGTVDIDGNHFYLYVKDILRSLLLMGWPSIIVVIHHQGLDGPEALSFRKAASELAFDLKRAEKGLGWWGYQPPETHGRVWDRVRVMPTILPEAAAVCRGDHAGHFETSLLMHLHPEMVDLSQLARQSFWYTDQPDNLARTSTAEDGKRYFEAMVAAWVRLLAAEIS
jgi:creatinine amidohydrolase/Fe(II)-dependent formamide hydrolase-like protein